MSEIWYINDPQGLGALYDRVHDAAWLALDTEFLRERTYYPQLCLVQLATPQVIACIDVLALQDLGPLRELLEAPVTKVLHAAGQDLEVLDVRLGTTPQSIFDTQVAAALTGDGDAVGYAALVEARLGVHLPKSHTRTDWSARPLTEDQLAYAADDVRFLGPLYEQLHAELARRGRLEWLDEEMARLTTEAMTEAQPRVKHNGPTDGPTAAALAALAQWREEQARHRDRPRQWIVPDAALVAVAHRRPRQVTELADIHDLPRAAMHDYGEAIIDVLQRAGPAHARGYAPLERPERERVKRLAERVRQRAHEAALSPALLAPRRDLERLVRGDHDAAVAHGWRREVVGEELLAIIEEEGRTAD